MKNFKQTEDQIPSEFKKSKLNDTKLRTWEKYWIRNPIDALTGKTANHPIFFTAENDISNFTIQKLDILKL